MVEQKGHVENQVIHSLATEESLHGDESGPITRSRCSQVLLAGQYFITLSLEENMRFPTLFSLTVHGLIISAEKKI